MNDLGKYEILIVDDEKKICEILGELFKIEGYVVRCAYNGKEALNCIEKRIPDLVISDIQMPLMDGFQLFKVLKTKYPSVKHILMTSYDVDRYISLIRRYNIGNILIKGYEFSVAEVKSYVETILTGNIFGLKRYFPGNEINSVSLCNYAKAKEVSSQISRDFKGEKNVYLEIAIDELISNAFFHGVLKLSDLPREQWPEYAVIDTDKAIKVSWTYDDEKIGVSIEDPQGNLKKMDVLKWIDSYRPETESEVHGRGFLLVRKLIDRLVINIDPGKKTECIIIQYYKHDGVNRNKPLMIHEL
ncbi:MAG: response regulator [Fibrobacter sp.]|nr:response regulator [Fibrobacter sp.]